MRRSCFWEVFGCGFNINTSSAIPDALATETKYPWPPLPGILCQEDDDNVNYGQWRIAVPSTKGMMTKPEIAHFQKFDMRGVDWS